MKSPRDKTIAARSITEALDGRSLEKSTGRVNLPGVIFYEDRMVRIRR